MNKQQVVIASSLAGISVVLLYLLQPMLLPFIAGFVLAYLLDPVVERLVAVGLNRTLAVCAVIIISLLLALTGIMLLLPALQHQILRLVAFLPTLFDWFNLNLMPWLEQSLGQTISFDVVKLKQQFMAHWQQVGSVMVHALNFATGSGVAVISWLSTVLLIPVVMFYLLRDWPVLLQSLEQLLPRQQASTIIKLAQECDEVLSAFIRGQLLVMSALAILYGLGLSLIGLDMALLVGALAGLLSVVPYLGFLIGIVLALAIGFFQFDSMSGLLPILIVFAVVQMIEGTVLTPTLVGEKIGLHPVAVIFALLAGGQLFGFVGVFLALPVAAVLMVLLRYVLFTQLRA